MNYLNNPHKDAEIVWIILHRNAEFSAATEKSDRKCGHSRTRHSQDTNLLFRSQTLGNNGKYGNLGFEGQMESLAADGLVSKYPPAPVG